MSCKKSGYEASVLAKFINIYDAALHDNTSDIRSARLRCLRLRETDALLSRMQAILSAV